MRGWLFSKRSIILPVTITLVTALVLLQPSQIWTQEPAASQGNAVAGQTATSTFPPITNCRVTQQPISAIDMNVVSHGSKVKTIHVEKIFFDCLVGTAPAIAMVSIYNELFEDVSTGSLAKHNIVETCVKDLTGTVLGCRMLTAPSTLPTVTTCVPQPVAFPARMSTVLAIGPQLIPNVAETVEAEKEIFSCNDVTGSPTIQQDVVIFTRILEDMDTGKAISTKFASVNCAIDLSGSAAVACK